MKLIRLLGVVIIFYGLSYQLHGLTQLLSWLGSTGDNPLLQYVTVNLTIGIVTFVIGVGLVLLKEWARVAWLVCTIVLLPTHLFLSLFFFASGQGGLDQQILNVLLIIILSLISWLKLTQPSQKQLFVGATSRAPDEVTAPPADVSHSEPEPDKGTN